MEDRAVRRGADFAYVGLNMPAPLLILLFGTSGLLMGEEAGDGHLAVTLEQWFGCAA